ncbi:hypothetical protein [Bacillus wiedmannii]|uniref:hypothetical protein n=1 Tax=Bacillus wiedmannii TaxID=1890302 RepID=UPI000BFA96FA|nr:hypothetical protein [Bacillus wiedmannii]PGA35148.1 hypothetical protein COL74_06890 [Bacillus wiedmannii]PHB96724.1 hypothetical protein COE96_15125 [Bacillus wiedmannii]
MKYGYARVSAVARELAVQIEVLKNEGYDVIMTADEWDKFLNFKITKWGISIIKKEEGGNLNNNCLNG